MEPIVFPDVEDLLVTYLTDTMGASVHTVPPIPRPNEFVLVPRVGGVRHNIVVDGATIGFECWSLAPSDAFALCQTVRAVVNSLPGKTLQGSTVYKVDEMSGPVNLPDPQSRQARYVFTSIVYIRGSKLDLG